MFVFFVFFDGAAVLHLEQGSTVAIKGTVCLHSVPKLVVRKQISLINYALHRYILCSTLPSEVYCTELSEGLDTDKASQRSSAAHAFPPLAVSVENSGELSLAFAEAAQCGVVEGVLNK